MQTQTIVQALTSHLTDKLWENLYATFCTVASTIHREAKLQQEQQPQRGEVNCLHELQTAFKNVEQEGGNHHKFGSVAQWFVESTIKSFAQEYHDEHYLTTLLNQLVAAYIHDYCILHVYSRRKIVDIIHHLSERTPLLHPKTFLAQLLRVTARAFFFRADLFDYSVDSKQRIQNVQESGAIIRECFSQTIYQSIPWREIHKLIRSASSVPTTLNSVTTLGGSATGWSSPAPAKSP